MGRARSTNMINAYKILVVKTVS